MTPVFAFACRLANAPEWGETVYNRATSGKAKYDHYVAVREHWNVKYTDIRVRKIGRPESTEQFIHTAEGRGLPDLRCGHRVRVGDSEGTVVGHGASANFEVLFDAGKYAGQTLFVHPCEMKVLERTDA